MNPLFRKYLFILTGQTIRERHHLDWSCWHLWWNTDVPQCWCDEFYTLPEHVYSKKKICLSLVHPSRVLPWQRWCNFTVIFESDQQIMLTYHNQILIKWIPDFLEKKTYQSVGTSILEILKLRSAMPPTGTLSLPVAKWSSFFCSSRGNKRTTSQKQLWESRRAQTHTHISVNNDATPWRASIKRRRYESPYIPS